MTMNNVNIVNVININNTTNATQIPDHNAHHHGFYIRPVGAAG